VHDIKQTILEYADRQLDTDPTLRQRMAAYAANNTGRSIANMRDPSFSAICETYGVQHFLQSMVDFKRIEGRQTDETVFD
jgi:hypothetical protein